MCVPPKWKAAKCIAVSYTERQQEERQPQGCCLSLSALVKDIQRRDMCNYSLSAKGAGEGSQAGAVNQAELQQAAS